MNNYKEVNTGRLAQAAAGVTGMLLVIATIIFVVVKCVHTA